MGERRVFTGECKELALKTDRNLSEITRELGINGNMPARWKREMKQSERGPMKKPSPVEEMPGMKRWPG
jgi:transposase-like protein